MPQFERKNIRLSEDRYIGRKWYFLTMVAEGRAKWFHNYGDVRENLVRLKEHADTSHFTIPAYCFMPDHLHVLTFGTQKHCDLLRFIDGFKQASSFAFQQQAEARLWQKKFHDHILRSNERWEAVACYIWLNPVRAGLCASPEHWLHSGSFTLDWRRLLTIGIVPWVPNWKRTTIDDGRSLPG